jgi:hypothetical protein
MEVTEPEFQKAVARWRAAAALAEVACQLVGTLTSG